MGERRASSDNMKFTLTITTPMGNLDKLYELPFITGKDTKYSYELGVAEISTVDELIQLLDIMDEMRIPQEIVIGRYDKQSPPYIEIYNDYRE